MIAMIAAGFFIAYNSKLKRANRAIEESRGAIQAAYASEAAARRQAEDAGKRASEQHAIAVKALNEARDVLDLANRLLEGMEISLGQLRGPTAMIFPLRDRSEFLETMRENQTLAAKVAYAAEETFEPMMREARLPGLTGEAVRNLRSKISWQPMMPGGESHESEAMHRLQGHFDLILGRLLAMKVRCYEYNWACARMKKDTPRFSDPRSNAWRLVPDHAVQFSGKAADAAREAKALLQRVVEDHPGTNWALAAQRELDHPFGFKWVETYVKPVEREPSRSNE